MEPQYKPADRFEKARESLWNLPGFQRRQSTITASGSSFFPEATWVIQTIITDDDAAIFLERIDSEGGQRLVLPTIVARTIYRHYDEIMKKRRSIRGQRGAETRKRLGVPLFGGNPHKGGKQRKGDNPKREAKKQ